MTSKTWIGSAKTDWFTAGAWNPSGVPADGDAVVITSGGPTLSHEDEGNGPIGSHAVTLGSKDFSVPASITSYGYSFGNGFDISVGYVVPFAVLNFGAEYAANGTLISDTTFDGQIDVSNGILNLDTSVSSPVTTNPSTPPVLEGSGTTTIGRGGMVAVTGGVAATQTVSFADTNGTLFLNNPADFAAQITDFQAGDRIELGHLQVAESVDYDATTGKLTIYAQGGGVLATLNLQESGGPLQFYVAPFGHGGSVITTSQQTRMWAGGTGDWYDSASWQNGAPLGGDTAAINAGTAVISGADATTYGALDFETIMLGNPAGNTPVTLQTTDATFGEGLTIVTAGTPQYVPDYIAPQATWQASGLTRFEGTIEDQATGGTLTISIGANSAFTLVGVPPPIAPEDQSNFASILVGQESQLVVDGGPLTDNGLILVDGTARFSAGSTLNGAGTVEMEAGGSVQVDGTVSSDDNERPTFEFADNTGTLTLSNLGAFQGQVQVFKDGDRIDLSNVQARSIGYAANLGTDYGTLTLLDAGGAPVGHFLIDDPNGAGAADFTLGPDSTGGTLITYTPQGPTTLLESLPVPAVGTTGQLIPFATLLTEAFGSIPAGYATYTLSGPVDFHVDANQAYWEQPPNGTSAKSYWLLNGQVVQKDTTISADQISDVQFVAGNNIPSSAYFTVPTAVSGSGAVTEYTEYKIWTVNPAVDAPETGYSTPDPGVPGSASLYGAPDPSDIVASAYRYNTVYDQPPNTDDCNYIADNVGAGAGAVMPFIDASTDPSQNQQGGFWRIVYRGSDTPNPVQDWYSLVQPGDVVRMGRIDQNGQHTTTIVGTVNPDGSIAVYDNGDHNSSGVEVIGVHDVTYWPGTDPNTITIYRLDPYHQYLVTGTGQSEFIQGSVFNNLIEPGGGRDTITGGGGDNEVQGVTADLNGITVTDWHLGDTLDFTDLVPAQAGVAFAGATLTVSANGRPVAQLTLNGVQGQPFFIASDNAGGTIVTSSPFDLGQYASGAAAIIAGRLAPLAQTGKTTKITTTSDLSSLPSATAGEYNIAQLTAPAVGETVQLPGGYNSVFLQGTASVILTDTGMGNAMLVANTGNDTMTANGPNDTLVANGGNDLLFGNPDGSVLVAGSGADTLVAGAGTATLIGGAGQTLAFGGTGRMTFVGGTGNATVVAGSGSANVYGGTGSMTVWGGAGGGAFFGGAAGNNVLVAGDGATTIAGGGSGDLLAASGSGNTLLAAGVGNETLFGAGGSGNNLYFGGGGNDVIVAGAGNDTVVAGAGDTTVFGGSGATAVFTGSGVDVIVAGKGGGYIGESTGSSTTWIPADAGGELFGFVDGQGGGNDQIVGFRTGIDHLQLNGYEAGAVATVLGDATVSGGSSTLTLSDNTQITLIGVTSLHASDFV